MKKRTAIILLAVILLVAAAAGMVWSYSRTVVLGEKYPFLARETVPASVAWAHANEKASSHTVEGDYASILRDARVTKGIKTGQGPDVGLLLFVVDEEEKITYSIEVGQDGTVTVAPRNESMERSRTYWKDKDGDLFDKLYQCYLENGGEEILK